MNRSGVTGFVLGLAAGITVYGLYGVGEMTRLRAENAMLSEDLEFLAPAFPTEPEPDAADLPYHDPADARNSLAAAKAAAVADDRILMVTFGANWCEDCRALHRQLKDPKVAEYVATSFRILNVNVGKFNRNITLAHELGVSLDRGIPVAVFYDASGKLIGNTNGGELEPARLYTSNQILKFIRDVAERQRIARPDAL